MKNLIGSGSYMASPNGDPLAVFRSRREQARAGGGRKALESIRATGRGTARDRIDLLTDPNSFVEVDTFVTHRTTDHNMFLHQTLGDGVVTGHGTIDGRRVYCFAQDFSVHGGSMGEMHAKKIAKLVEMAERSKTPLVCVWDGGGQRAQDGIDALAGTGELLDRLVQCSGRVPIISLVLGPVVGVSALAASLSDFTILGEEHGQLFLSSPLETPEVQRGEVDAAGLGGASLHASRSGIACLVADDEDDAFFLVQEILSYLPDHNDAEPPFVPTEDPITRLNDELESLVPDNPNRPYNMVSVVEEVVDDGEFLELFPNYAENIIIGFARLEGRLKLHGLFGFATHSTFLSARLKRYLVSFLGLFKNGAESSDMVQNCCLHMLRPLFQNSPSSLGKPTVEHILQCPASTCKAITTSLGPRQNSQ